MIVETLRVFATVAEQSNFSRAAELMNLSQPGVSLHIRNLENELGTKLMHRSPKHVKLTAAGEILYRHAKQILSLYEEARQEIRLLQDEVTGTLKIGASFTIGEYLLPRLLAGYIREYPKVDVQVTIGNTEEINRAIVANDLDLGLVEGEVAQAELQAVSFQNDELVLIVSPDHALRAFRTVTPDQLQRHVWIVRERGSGTRAVSDRFFADAGMALGKHFVFNSTQGVKEAVAAGLGVAILSRLTIQKELLSGELCEIGIEGYRFDRDFVLLQKQDHTTTMARKMLVHHVLTN
ncbi:LysR family transcriptional regulator [Paenibacillus whitsoniae]|uniref:LysR family transcriptional regulator n=1 Tax=Paenibacillus whitsoniae TaxID=2496558 RepID=A0A3S0CCH8_9BACL|nr:LysR family transcriptional regulator [Paenibacillus whitsoniae]RTE09784.1 LysR family transcriptional regulator [Paenibacillus whitsoniae]